MSASQIWSNRQKQPKLLKTVDSAAIPILVGKLSGVFGVKGWVKVFSYTQPKENILTYKTWLLSYNGDWQTTEILDGKLHGKTIIAKLKGCDDRDQAAALIDTEVAIKSEQLERLSNNKFYWAELIGCTVLTTEGEQLGTVDKLMETGANDVLVVGKDCLIPFAQPEIVKAIDLEKGEIVVDWTTEFC